MFSRLTDPAISPIWHAESAAEGGDSRHRLEDEVVVLFDQYREPLLRYLSNFGVAIPDGEDVIQEVFLALFRHLYHGKPRENLRGWLFQVAHNLASRRRYRTRLELEARAEAGFRDLGVDLSPSPEAQMAHDETQQLLLAVVNALPEADRRCLFLRAEGLRYREIAQTLGISLGAVSLSLARSLARIARAAGR